jgi:hypothetical protein
VRRLYPSIPHLPGSRAARDKVLPAGLASLCVDPRSASPGTEVIVQEKLDGSCVAVRVDRGSLYAFGREGRLAALSRNAGRRMFADWVGRNEARLREVVRSGETLAGEWLALVHGTRYALAHEPFVPFDVLRDQERLPFAELARRLEGTGLAPPGLVHRGAPIDVEDALAKLGPSGLHGAIDPPEGLVYRVERRGKVVLVAKWVRPDKVDGAFLPENTGADALYHWTPT